MGMFKKSCYTAPVGCTCRPQYQQAFQPDPTRFKVTRIEQYGTHFVSEVVYENCSNYEGRKVLLTSDDPRKYAELDPHFQPGGFVVARFEPTKQGWKMAVRCAGDFL